MQKIISLFQRNYESDHFVRDAVVPGAEWVLSGEGIATLKHNGTCCLILSGVLYKRHDVKKGKSSPMGFIPAQAPDAVTGHHPGWLPVSMSMVLTEDQWHREAWADLPKKSDGTYELVGPKVQGNQGGYARHLLLKHGDTPLPLFPRTYSEIHRSFQSFPWEGVVWHHPDGRMVKIKVRDFPPLPK